MAFNLIPIVNMDEENVTVKGPKKVHQIYSAGSSNSNISHFTPFSFVF